MNVLTFIILTDLYFIVHCLDLSTADKQYLTKVENLFCLKSFLTPSTLQTLIDDIPVLPPEERDVACCGYCSLDVETCDVTDSCCVEALEMLPHEKGSSVRMTCDYPQLRPYKKSGYPNWDWPTQMFRKCPQQVHTTSVDVISKCDNSENYNEIYTKIPVTDATTMYIYKNRYCAYCHNIIEANLHYWHTELQCVRGILKPRNISSVVTEILATENCNLIYFRPASLGYEGPFYDCKMVISQCNVTGQWQQYDHVIEAGCLAYSTIFNYKYRNVFCYLCNTNDTYGATNCSDTPSETVFADFTALLKFAPEVRMVNDLIASDTCSVDQIYDPLKKLCRDIECLFPKTVENGRCVNLVEELRGVTFGMFLKMTPSEDIKIFNRSYNSDFAGNLKDLIRSWLNVKLDSYLVSIYIYAKRNTESSEILNGIYYAVTYFVVYIEAVFEFPMNTDIIDYMLAIQDTHIDSSNFSQNVTFDKFKVEIDDYDVRELYSGEFDLIVSDDGFKSDYPVTILNIAHTCPLVRIFSFEFNMSRSFHSIFIEELNDTVDIKDVLIENITNDEEFSVCMCIHLFKELTGPFANIEGQLKRQHECETTTVSTKAIVSLVCCSISILFSVCTLIIYLRFKELKTQPGINNIVLCSALIFAQALFQFGSGQSCKASKVTCQFIGILVHFSWLFLMFWMNSCCIHMFRVFRLRRTTMVPFNTTKTTLTYLLYSFSSSFILVLINIIMSLHEGGGKGIGYGGSMCYISDGHMVAFLFALPVGVVVFINLFLFLAVVIQLKSSHTIQNRSNERNFLHIYVKLSTLTGGTWLFGFLSIFLNVVVLDYIFITLNASQGMFLFLAFVANRRTLNFLRNGEHSQTGSTRTTRT